MTVLITGASGEVGTGLIDKLHKNNVDIVALDINNLEVSSKGKVTKFIKGSVIDEQLIKKLFKIHKFDTIYHLAALLSTSAEKDPGRAHIINSGGTFNLLDVVNKAAGKNNKKIKFIFPSTIAVYGMGDKKDKADNPKVKENEFLSPITMYGVNKLYCENLGIYYSSHYQLLNHSSTRAGNRNLDFRCVRFPGLLSAFTIPTGGTSDYAPEMIHAAAAGKSYKSFVRPDTTIGFMAMPDAVDSLIQIARVNKKKLSRHVYNITGFSASARDFEGEVKKYYPKAKITYKVDKKRQRIVDSWPMDTDDSLAKKDWSWKPKFTFKKCFADYLIPNIRS